MKTLLVLSALLASEAAYADRLKDVAFVRGVRENELVGYGLVVGLRNTGDDQGAVFTVQSVTTMLRRLGVQVDPTQMRLRNVAAVMVTARLPPYARSGSKLDVVVSSLGSATSLQGGALLQTPLKGADGRVYALAQGSLSLGGFEVGSRTGSYMQKNQVTTGRVPSGALVERESVDETVLKGNDITLVLNTPDFTTADRLATSINAKFGEKTAAATDPSAVTVKVPKEFADRAPAFVAALEALEVTPDALAKVVINERTGTVVAGQQVKLSPAAVAFGGLFVEVRESYLVSQAAPWSAGTTQVVPQSEVKAGDTPGKVHALAEASTLGDVVKVLNGLGASPRDLIAILQAMQRAGALHAEVEVQ